MLLCPSCGRPIPPEDINIPQDVAMCRGCGAVMSVSGAVHGAATAAVTRTFDPASPPSGAWFRDDGVEVTIGATTRSSTAVFLVPFFLVWGGGSLGGIYGSQIASGKFDPILSLFGLIFVAGTCAIGSFAMLSVWGRVEVKLRQGTGTVFVGVGSIGWRKRFDAAAVTEVSEDWAGWSQGKAPRRAICLTSSERVKFGSLLSQERRQFVLESLRHTLKQRA